MNYQIKTQDKKFEPININLTIETEDELIEILARINCSIYKIKEDGHTLAGIDLDNYNLDNFDSLYYDLRKIAAERTALKPI